MLEQYSQHVALFTERHLTGYNDWLRSQPAITLREKEFNDPVWGTISLDPLEVLVLDSPLLQRLRRIRQLGTVHFVYPGAQHTRLEHSLGVVHQTQQLIETFNRDASLRYGSEPVPPGRARLLRLAALVHDVGHGLMSHVSENALAHHEALEDLQLDFKRAHGISRAYGEINSYLIIGTETFRSMLAEAQRVSQQHLADDPPTIQTLQRLVIGVPIDDAFPNLQEVISGPFDADKLDYMARDARMSGVPSVVDVDRLVSKARVSECREEDLPLRVAQNGVRGRTKYVLCGIDRSGSRTLDELTLGRTLLFDKLYRHHKVRAAEAMVAAMVAALAESLSADELLSLPLWLTDEGVLRLDVPAVSALPAFSGGADVPEHLSRRLNFLSEALRDRDLFVRVLAFSKFIPRDPYKHEPEQSRALEALLRHTADFAERRELSGLIAQETLRVIEVLGHHEVLEPLPDKSLTDYVWIDPPRPVKGILAPTRALLIHGERAVMPYSEDAPETPNWASAYHITRDLGYIFGPRRLADHMCLAAERLLRDRYGLKLPNQALELAKRDPNRLGEIRTALAERGYYNDAPLDLLPTRRRLLRADVGGRVRAIAEALQGYSTPLVDPREQKAPGFSIERIEDFLAQFQDDGWISAMLFELESLTLVGRRTLNAAVANFLDTHPEFREGTLVPFGAARDSSAIVTYFSVDLAEQYGLQARSLAEALLDERPLLFVDDIVFSGGQGSAIVQSWFGNLAPAQSLGEDRRDQVLTPDLCDRLRERKIVFVYAAGKSEGAQRVVDAARGHGVEADYSIGMMDDGLPRAFARRADDESTAQLRERCRNIGLQLLGDNANSEERALGYGNEGLLVVFPYNTPTQTLTCLWRSGSVDGRPWNALVPRRSKS